MPFIPHTEEDIHDMLETLHVPSIDSLFDEIPATLRLKKELTLPKQLKEMELARLMRQRAALDADNSCFIGAGAYEHHIPAAVWEVTSRGEFMTAYTPYQAEASQGTLQLLYEYQTMMASLMALDVSNASLYEGGSALAEAILMAIRSNRKNKLHRIFIPITVHPHYREVVRSIVIQQGIELIDVDFDVETGRVSLQHLNTLSTDNLTALVIPQPNFFGVLEEVDALTDWAHAHQALAIGVVNPTAMALLNPPGKWGEAGADIAAGDGQPLGVPLASGGPYYGFLCCKEEYVRQLPGRIVGRTVDQEGKQGFVLTLQAREQHIRRAKATSNICTNQGLLVTASTLYMSLLGPEGLYRVALASYQNTRLLKQKLVERGLSILFPGPSFHEFVLMLQEPVETVLQKMAKEKIQAGFNLQKIYPELGQALLVCVTETKTVADLDHFVKTLAKILSLPELTEKKTEHSVCLN